MVMASETSSSWYERLEAWMSYNRGVAFRHSDRGNNLLSHPSFHPDYREFSLLGVMAQVRFAASPTGNRYLTLELVADDAEEFDDFELVSGKRLIYGGYQMPGMGQGTNRTIMWGRGFDSDNWTRVKIDENWFPAADSFRWRIRNIDPSTVGTNDLVSAIFFFRLR